MNLFPDTNLFDTHTQKLYNSYIILQEMIYIMAHLSHKTINSYCGNVVPLRLVSEYDISGENIIWKCDGECVTVKDFSKENEWAFNDGILLTLTKPGNALVECIYNNQTYTCTVNVRERKTTQNCEKFNVYPADLHIHTSNNHNHGTFPYRDNELASDCVKTTYESGVLECSVLTDHAGVSNARDFFKCFIADEEVAHDGLIIFPGAESEVSVVGKDRYGTDVRYSGEIVTINATGFSNSHSWEEFYNDLSGSQFAIASLAHPLVAGWSTSGIWNFQLYKNSRNPEFRRLVRLTEVGRGDYSITSMLYHYAYSQALDAGLKVSPCSTSDSHGSYQPCVGKTFIVSPEKSKEMFYDAIVNNRVYACDSGVVKFMFTVNDVIMGQTLSATDTYKFHVEASLLKDEPESKPIKCTIVSDYGNKIYTCAFNESVDFEIKSDTARYFYVMLSDSCGKKVWSSPIWTGRKFDDFSYMEELNVIDKADFTAWEESSKKDASVLVNDNPSEIWSAESKTASVIIDMGIEKAISAVGHIAPAVNRAEAAKNNVDLSKIVTMYASLCRISVSTDNISYKEVFEGYVRSFGGEEILYFNETNARYVKFEVLSTVGADTEREDLKDAFLQIAELSIFTK